MAAYRGPRPRVGDHRYISLVFRQNGLLPDDEDDYSSLQTRLVFDVAAYVRRHELTFVALSSFFSNPDVDP